MPAMPETSSDSSCHAVLASFTIACNVNLTESMLVAQQILTAMSVTTAPATVMEWLYMSL